MLLTGVLLVLLSWTAYGESSASECLDRFMDCSLLKFRSNNIELDLIMGTNMDHEIRLITSIQFNCSTSINSVILGIDVRGGTNNRDMFPSFQVWRPIGESDYTLVTERIIVYAPANVSRTGVYEYPLVPSIDVMAGDLIGISQPSQGDSIVRCYYIDNIAFNSYELALQSATMVTISGNLINDQLILVYPITAQPNCVNSPVSSQYIIDQSLLITEARTRDRRQFIYPDMMFRCNGTINKWIYGGIGMSGTVGPELQIWRQSSSNTYTKIASTEVIANETGPDSNVHEYYLDTPIEFMEGDVFGMFVPNENNDTIALYGQRDSGPDNYRVMGNVDTPPSTDLTLSSILLEGGNDYPLVSLEIMIAAVSSIVSTSTTVAAMATVTSITINSTTVTETTSLAGAFSFITTSTNTSSIDDSYYTTTTISNSIQTNNSTSSIDDSYYTTTPSSTVNMMTTTSQLAPVVIGTITSVLFIVIVVVAFVSVVVIVLFCSRSKRKMLIKPSADVQLQVEAESEDQIYCIVSEKDDHETIEMFQNTVYNSEDFAKNVHSDVPFQSNPAYNAEIRSTNYINGRSYNKVITDGELIYSEVGNNSLQLSSITRHDDNDYY